MATLTLHQGEATAEFEEHPTEIARRALMAAAEVEMEEPLASQMRRFALLLPRRGPRTKEGVA